MIRPLADFEKPGCECPMTPAIVINAYNEARARCLECGEVGLVFLTDPPADTLR